jgi:hypothetical protein
MKKKWRPLDAANKIIHHYITNIKGIARGYAATRFYCFIVITRFYCFIVITRFYCFIVITLSFLIYTNTDTR